MPFEPRFRRVAALNRRFVDRESAITVFTDEIRRVGNGPRILNVTGAIWGQQDALTHRDVERAVRSWSRS